MVIITDEQQDESMAAQIEYYREEKILNEAGQDAEAMEIDLNRRIREANQ